MNKVIFIQQEISVKFNNESYHPVVNNLFVKFYRENVWGIDDGWQKYGDLVPQSIKDLEEKMKWDGMHFSIYTDRIELIEDYMANADVKIRFIFAYKRDNLIERIKNNNLSDNPEDMTDEDLFTTLYDYYGITMEGDNRDETLSLLPSTPEVFAMFENGHARDHNGLTFYFGIYDVEKKDDKLNITFSVDPFLNEDHEELVLTYDPSQQVLSGLDDLIKISELPQSELATALEKLKRLIDEYRIGNWYEGYMVCPYSEIEKCFKSTFHHELTVINKELN